ncbi:hypothetical protein QYM36_007961 [Artemia franciscana]|uniref:Uncharacterized protein n=1 Tax=Artemia franciscana TaxID=6661 RepID=A0AA88IAC6_ARTSF|nr:hypothetical protein QYM36_007961 [Artemia franciscana]
MSSSYQEKTIEEHDADVCSVLIWAREKAVKSNLERCMFGSKSILYFGPIFSENGIHPDPIKVSAQKEMRPPTTKDELQIVLAMMNYCAWDVSNLSSLNQSLRDLAKQQQLKQEHQYDTAFTNINESICSSLASIDPTPRNNELQVDAFKFGLGATIIQNENQFLLHRMH